MGLKENETCLLNYFLKKPIISLSRNVQGFISWSSSEKATLWVHQELSTVKVTLAPFVIAKDEKTTDGPSSGID